MRSSLFSSVSAFTARVITPYPSCGFFDRAGTAPALIWSIIGSSSSATLAG